MRAASLAGFGRAVLGWEVVRVRTGGEALLGPFDLPIEDNAAPDPDAVAWQVLMAAMGLGTLDEGMGSLKEPALTLLQEGV